MLTRQSTGELSGIDTKREFDVTLTSLTSYPTAIKWIIKVDFDENGKESGVVFTRLNSEIAITGFDGEISSVTYSLDEAQRVGDDVTVTVNGSSLPETLYYIIAYKKVDGGETYVGAETAVKAEGTPL